MTEQLPELRHLFLTFTLCLPRLLAAFTVIPFMSRQTLPGLVRTGVAMSLALVVYPIVEPQVPRDGLATWLVLGLILKETFIGLLIGFTVAALFWAVEAAGFFIDNQRGAAIAGSIDPLLGTDSSPLGIMLLQAYVVYFFVSGGFLVFLGGLYDSYRVWSVTSFVPQLPPEAAEFFLGELDRITYLMVLLAAPVIIAMFLSELGLALISRFAPSLNVFFLAMPIKSGVAIFVLILYVGYLFDYLDESLSGLPEIFAELRRVVR